MLRELRTFITACQCGTFTAAAHRLGMSQPAVSDHIRRLETFAGAPLFYRTGRSATLNAAGRAMLPAAEEALLLLESMRVRAAPGVLRGHLRVGTITSLHTTLLARAMVTFRRTHPLVSVRVIRRDEHMVGEVERQEFDLAMTVRPNDPLHQAMTWLPLLRKPLVLIAPADCAAGTWQAAAATSPLLRYDETSATGKDVDDVLAAAGVIVKESIWVNYADTMISLVAQGLGVAIIPRTALGPDSASIKELPLGVHQVYREMGVIRRTTKPNGGALADGFIDALRTESRREPCAELVVVPPSKG